MSIQYVYDYTIYFNLSFFQRNLLIIKFNFIGFQLQRLSVPDMVITPLSSLKVHCA